MLVASPAQDELSPAFGTVSQRLGELHPGIHMGAPGLLRMAVLNGWNVAKPSPGVDFLGQSVSPWLEPCSGG